MADGNTFPPFNTIPGLNPASSLNFTDQVWINQNGADLRCNIGDLAALAPAGVTSVNGRGGHVVLVASDIVSAEGALITSPAFVGVPTAVTAAPGTSTTQLATTEFVTDALANASPGVASFNSRTGAVSLTLADIVAAGGVSRNSPAFTGTPIAPTPPPGNNGNQLATTAFVVSALAVQAPGVTMFNNRTGPVTLTLSDVTSAGGAPLSSPVLVGVPQAPTAALGSSTTQIATTAFVANAIAGSVAGVSSFNGRVGAVTLTTADLTAAGGATAAQLSIYAPLASPQFTGTPVAPTAALGTATTQLATTQFVSNALAGVTGVTSFNSRQGAVTLTAGDITGAGGALLASPVFTGAPQAPTPSTADNSNAIATTAFVDAALAASPQGTVTSVAMTVPNIFTLTGSPITGAGTLALGNRAQNANTVFAGPVSGGQAGGVFRALVAADIPSLSGTYLPLTGGTLSGPLALPTLDYSGTNWSISATANTYTISFTGTGALAQLSNAGDLYTSTLHSTNPSALCSLEGAAGNYRSIQFMSSGSMRWDVIVDNAPESGGNAGSNFNIARYSDTGVWIDSPIQISRASGNVTVSDTLYVGGAATFNSNATVGGQVNASGNITSSGNLYANGGNTVVSGPAATYRGFQMQTAGLVRWWIAEDTSPESGANAGSNFFIASYADDGSNIDSPLQINRATGHALFTQQLQANGPIIGESYIQAGGQVYANQFFTAAAAAGLYRGLYVNTAGTGARWFVGCDNAAETGFNAGSNFAILAYNDASSSEYPALTINRVSGNAVFAGYITSPALDITGVFSSGINNNYAIAVDAPAGKGAYITLNSPANPTAPYGAGINSNAGGNRRWLLQLGDGTAETGSNAGSNLSVQSFSDTGAFLGVPFQIIRATGAVTFGGPANAQVTVTNASVVIGSGNLNLNSGTVACNGFYSGGAAHCASTLQVDGQITQGQHPGAGPNQIVVGYYQGGAWFNGETLSVNVSNTSAAIQYNNGSETVTWSVAASDRRLKSNFKPASDALDYIKRLKVYDLDFNPGVKPTTDDMPESGTEHWPFSLIADEVAEVMPHAAMSREEDDGKHWIGLHPTHLCATLWRAVQQLAERNDALAAEVAALKAART